MKTTILSLGMLIFLFGLCACRSDKFLNRQQSKTRLSETRTDSLWASRQQSFSAVSSSRDSSNSLFKLSIYPTDTFQFSFDKGFRGRASKVELMGSVRNMVQLRDSSAWSDDKANGVFQETDRQQSTETAVRVRDVERKAIGWVWLVLLLAGLLGLTLAYRSFKN